MEVVFYFENPPDSLRHTVKLRTFITTPHRFRDADDIMTCSRMASAHWMAGLLQPGLKEQMCPREELFSITFILQNMSIILCLNDSYYDYVYHEVDFVITIYDDL